MRILFVTMVALILSGTSGTTDAQIGMNININLGNQPAWGPTGYDYVENYYIPDIEVYYNIPTRRYYYYDGGTWIYSLNMPSRYRSYDLYTTYKVVVNDRNPWKNHVINRNKYSSFKGRHEQLVIRDSKEQKYFANKNHPEHNNWIKTQKHDNANNKSVKNGRASDKQKNQNNHKGNGKK